VVVLLDKSISGVEFVAVDTVDNPHATRLTLHILAAVAEHEREMIAERQNQHCGRPKRAEFDSWPN
jgi:DNA invertase Pin-like site-specific DNA recombinase